MDFCRGGENDISRGRKIGEISFYPSETKKTTFFAKNLLGKCHPGGAFAPSAGLPLSIAHVLRIFHYLKISRTSGS